MPTHLWLTRDPSMSTNKWLPTANALCLLGLPCKKHMRSSYAKKKLKRIIPREFPTYRCCFKPCNTISSSGAIGSWLKEKEEKKKKEKKKKKKKKKKKERKKEFDEQFRVLTI